MCVSVKQLSLKCRDLTQGCKYYIWSLKEYLVEILDDVE